MYYMATNYIIIFARSRKYSDYVICLGEKGKIGSRGSKYYLTHNCG
jgi:hypothetical protein